MKRNDLDKLLVLKAFGLIPTGAGVHHLNTLHDDDCPRMHGTTECTCDPDIVYNGKTLRLPKAN